MELGQDCGASLVLAPSGHGEGRLSPEEQAALDHAVAESLLLPSPVCRKNVGLATPHHGMLNFGNTCYAAAAVQLIATLDDAVSVAPHVASEADPQFTPRAADSVAQAAQRARELAETRDATRRRANVFNELVSMLRDPRSDPSARGAKLVELRQFLFTDASQQDAAEAVVSLLGRSEQCEGSLCSTVRCNGCDAVSTTYDEFFSLQLELPDGGGGLTLGACLERYTTASAVEYSCPACREEVGAEKGLSLAALPLALVMDLKRFGFDRSAAKIGDRVALPLVLSAGDMHRLVASDTVAVPPYRLRAFINHLGPSLANGHCTATCLSEDGQWVNYDDHIVSVHDTPDDRHAYLALYVACGDAEVLGPQGGETAGERHARGRDSETPHADDASADTPMGMAASVHGQLEDSRPHC